MENEEKKERGASPRAEEDEGTVEEAGNAASGPEAASEEETLSDADLLRREVEETKDRWLRAVADLDNYRKRVARDRERDLWSARAGVVLPILDVLDDFDRALDRDDAEAGLFRNGIEMIRQKLVGALSDLGITSFPSVGEPFDPERHDALQQIPSTEFQEGNVAFEIRRGYLSGDRILRHAMVAVAAAPDPGRPGKDRAGGGESTEQG